MFSTKSTSIQGILVPDKIYASPLPLFYCTMFKAEDGSAVLPYGIYKWLGTPMKLLHSLDSKIEASFLYGTLQLLRFVCYLSDFDCRILRAHGRCAALGLNSTTRLCTEPNGPSVVAVSEKHMHHKTAPSESCSGTLETSES